jgi:hypothetical protein
MWYLYTTGLTTLLCVSGFSVCPYVAFMEAKCKKKKTHTHTVG